MERIRQGLMKMTNPTYGDPDHPAPNADPRSTDDLHNTQSLYAEGGPMTDSRPTDYPLGAVPGYYSPGPLGNNRNDQGNPWVDGAGDPSGDLDAQRYMQDSLDAVTAANFDNLRSGTGTEDTEPSIGDFYFDTGAGRSGEGQS